MNYIINPSIFYWISVLDGLKIACIVFFIVSLFGLVGCGVGVAVDGIPYGDDEKKIYRAILSVSLPVFIVCFCGLLFIPSKQTMIEMLVAKTATAENAEWTLDAVKSAVDYILQAVKAG